MNSTLITQVPSNSVTRPHSERKRERSGKGRGKKERRRKKGARDGKLAWPSPSIFSALSRLNWGQQGVGSNVSESPWQPIPQPPVCARAHTHAHNTLVKLHPTVLRLVNGLHLWPDWMCYGLRRFMTHLSSSSFFPSVDAVSVHISSLLFLLSTCITWGQNYISHNPPVVSQCSQK